VILADAIVVIVLVLTFVICRAVVKEANRKNRPVTPRNRQPRPIPNPAPPTYVGRHNVGVSYVMVLPDNPQDAPPDELGLIWLNVPKRAAVWLTPGSARY
jgi:hypothetical protein